MEDKKFEVTAQIKVELTQEDIDDIMCGSLEGGCTAYWCCQVEVLEADYYGEYASEQISHGGSLRFHDSESDEYWDLTLEKFLKGFQMWVESGKAFVNGAIHDGKVDCSQIDALDADSIVQYGLFNDIVFG